MPQHQPRIDRARWPIIAADARLLGLRQAAKQHGISHESARQILKRVAAAEHSVTPQAAD